MKKISVLLFVAVFGFFFAGCSNNDDAVEEPNFLAIDGIKKSLVTEGNEPGLSVYFTGGGNEVDGQTGNYYSLQTNLIIDDPNQAFLGAYQNTAIRNRLVLKCITDIQSNSGNLKTIDYKQGVIGSSKIISQLIIDGNTLTAEAGQTIYFSQAASRTIVRFSRIHYGNYVVSGKINLLY